MVEERFGKYILLKRIAEGGMGEVFLARQRGLADVDRMVVLKRIRPSLRDNDTFEELFLTEARVSARLNHPNVVQLYEFGHINDSYFLTFEHVRGNDLARLRRRLPGPWPVDVILELALQALAGLGHVHSLEDFDGRPLRIVHRDISPSNVMISIDGMAKLLDFGVARPSDGGREQQIHGKYPYLSPEQCRYEQLDARSDIFSLGAVLYELLTGEKVFKRPTPEETIQAVVASNPTPPSQRVPAVPRAVDELVLKALAARREDRFENTEQMQSAIDSLVTTMGMRRGPRLLSRFLEELRSDDPSQSVRSVPLARPSAPPTVVADAPKNLLLVDDDDENLQALRRTFRNRFTLFTASDPQAALKIIEDNPIQIVITDQRMPGMTGVELLQHANRLRPGLIKVITSALSDAHTLLDAINSAGIHRYVVKPWRPEELQALVDELVREKGGGAGVDRLLESKRALEREVSDLVGAPADQTVLDLPAMLGHQRRLRPVLTRALGAAPRVGLVLIDSSDAELLRSVGARLADELVAPEELIPLSDERHAVLLPGGEAVAIRARLEKLRGVSAEVASSLSVPVAGFSTVLVPDEVSDPEEALLKAATDLLLHRKEARA